MLWLPASDGSKEAADYSIFVFREFTMFNVGSEIVKPSQPAAFPTSLKTWRKPNRWSWRLIQEQDLLQKLREEKPIRGYHFSWNSFQPFTKLKIQGKKRKMEKIFLPAFWGRAIQFPPVPYLSIYSFSFASSSGDHGPLFTFALSQQGALPISLTLSEIPLLLSKWCFQNDGGF